jgi:hypothetical protein
MSHATVRVPEIPAVSHKVVWFAPDRPVEGNTIYRLPLVGSADVDPDAEPETIVED